MERLHPAVRPWSLLTAALGVALFAGACGDSDEKRAAPAGSAPADGQSAVAVQLFQFQPSPLQVKSGTAITWTNRDETVHTVTSGAPGAADGRFNVTLDGKDTSFRFTISQPGTYAYFCARHDSMRGEIRVQ